MELLSVKTGINVFFKDPLILVKLVPIGINFIAAIECPFCKKSACKQCIKTFVLSIHDDPLCMFCSEKWNCVFFEDHMTTRFLYGPYKVHRTAILIDRQKSLFAETMPYIDEFIKYKKLEQTQHREVEFIESCIRKMSLVRNIDKSIIKNYQSIINIQKNTISDSYFN